MFQILLLLSCRLITGGFLYFSAILGLFLCYRELLFRRSAQLGFCTCPVILVFTSGAQRRLLQGRNHWRRSFLVLGQQLLNCFNGVGLYIVDSFICMQLAQGWVWATRTVCIELSL